MPTFPVNLITYVPGTPLINTRQIQFGNDTGQYLFPLTFQEQVRNIKLAVPTNNRPPFAYGSHIPSNVNVNQREITLVGSVGTGVLGSGGVALSDYNTLEAERALLAGMQVQGRQKLFTRWDRYLNAYLSEFDFKFHQDGGLYRYADWTLKFLADDPRYYGQYSANSASGFLSAGVTSFSAHHNGNVPSFPVFTFTGTLSGCSAPLVGVSAGAASLSLKFSKLSLASGETLTVICDPRPEYRNVAAIYNNISNVKFNALQYINGPADLVNTLDYTQFFPFVPPGVAAQSLTVGCSGYMNYSVAWLDTWL